MLIIIQDLTDFVEQFSSCCVFEEEISTGIMYFAVVEANGMFTPKEFVQSDRKSILFLLRRMETEYDPWSTDWRSLASLGSTATTRHHWTNPRQPRETSKDWLDEVMFYLDHLGQDPIFISIRPNVDSAEECTTAFRCDWRRFVNGSRQQTWDPTVCTIEQNQKNLCSNFEGLLFGTSDVTDLRVLIEDQNREWSSAKVLQRHFERVPRRSEQNELEWIHR